MHMHEATASDGDVVDVRHGSFWDGASVSWTDAERKDPSNFLVTVFENDSGSSRLLCSQ